ncbi:glycerophosphodiester phosphodiesterase family protein [Cellulomonas sp. PS-H5]|uniref:glycerophosphodiester phosphodiesterase n=1 Tax=Cellulomonas sp. PS-H5 TaxID=2820400 RepID=UPI001C4F042E|nr:glycerophosphodiester phosphodiesterase family protein [Cellulomonas sp. PS-H5]MBW0252479.1 hypothetical protein [Cellulomonas sp. PS-H5]
MHPHPARRRPRSTLAVAVVLALLSTGTIAAVAAPTPDPTTTAPAATSADPEPQPVLPPDKGPGDPITEASPDDAPAQTQPTDLEQSGRSATDVANQIDRECTKTSAEILSTLQDLGGRQQFTTVRHRGDFDARTPENSLPAFEKSYLRCRAGVETDLRRTADGTLVMFHDTHLGKMLEPTYDPEQNTGPNAALGATTWAELQQRDLVNIARQPQAGVKVPSFDEFLEHYVRVGGRSLLYVEIKNSSADQATSQREVLEAVEHLVAFHQRHPDAGIFDRVVLKFRMSVFGTFHDWSEAVREVPGLPAIPLSQVQLSAQIAKQIGVSPSFVDAVVTSWAATRPQDRMLSVEVTMKDSTSYSHLVRRNGNPEGPAFHGVEYYTAAGDATAPPGTMASAVEIVRKRNKPLGQFVPIPDWVFFRDPSTFTWDQVLPNVDAGKSTVPVTPREAYFNNNSRCCYALRDRIDPGSTQDVDAEQNDQRMLLPWLEDIGATFLTADDTDSIDAYFKARGKLLDTGDNRVTPNEPDLEMNSLIHPESRHIPSLLKYIQVSVRPVNEASTWHATARVRVTERNGPVPATMADHEMVLDSRTAPNARGVATYGQTQLWIDVSWRWSDRPDQDRNTASRLIILPEHHPDGTYTEDVWLTDGTPVRIHYTVSRQWAVASDFSATLLSNDTWRVHGTLCGYSSGPPAPGDRCNRGDLMETRRLFWVERSDAVTVAPDQFIPLSRDVVAGARPLHVRTDFTGRRVLPDMSLSHGTAQLDGWSTDLNRRNSRTIGGTSPHAVRIAYFLDVGSNRRAP